MSPVLRPTLISLALLGRNLSFISPRGPMRFFSMSLASALMGDMYTHCTASGSEPSRDLLTRSSIIVRNAVRVFPDPVGEQRSKCSPLSILGIATFWGSVKSGNLSMNQFLTGGQSLSRSSSDSILSSTYSICGIFPGTYQSLGLPMSTSMLLCLPRFARFGKWLNP